MARKKKWNKKKVSVQTIEGEFEVPVWVNDKAATEDEEKTICVTSEASASDETSKSAEEITSKKPENEAADDDVTAITSVPVKKKRASRK